MRHHTLSHSFFLSLSILLLFTFSGCNDDEGKKNQPEDEFEQGAMLTNIGENLIFPNYANFKAKAAQLETAVVEFTDAPTEEALAKAQEALKGAYLAWQKVNIYNFGPAEELALRDHVNTFPTQYTDIESKIASGSWNLSSFTAVDEKGLPALDYLLFKEGTAAASLPGFTTAENAEKRRQYLLEVAKDLSSFANEVYKGWNPEEGNYLGTFNTTLGNSANSSLSLLVNNLNEGYEMIKNKKLNIPLGNRSIDGEPIPRAVEAFYSGISLDLIKANLETVENTFRGRSNGNDGLGLDDNIDYHYEAGNIQNDLTDQILTQLTKARQAVEVLPDPLSEAVVSANEAGDQAYSELQALVVYLKNDLPQALSVLISYVDNDGD